MTMSNIDPDEFHDLSRRIRSIELSVTRMDEQGKVWTKMDDSLSKLGSKLGEIEKALFKLNSLEALADIMKEQEKKLTRLEMDLIEFKSKINTQKKIWASLAAGLGGAVGWISQFFNSH